MVTKRRRWLGGLSGGVLPPEISFRAAPNDVMIPHHFGFTFRGETIGVNANHFTASEDIDEITGNPLLRYIPCRVEKVEESA